MLNQLHKQLQQSDLLPVGSKIIVAVSAGVDSVTLLHLLHNLAHVYGWQLAIAHYNHGLRADATKDAVLVGDLANDYGYPIYVGKYDGSDFSEAALRKARYDFFESLRKDLGFDYVATAHHNGDLLETAIFNTIRGADREGMVSLKPKRGNIIRPLLNFTKPEIIVFANLQGLPYREDSTNDDLSYSRNLVRNIILPHGSAMFRDFHHKMNGRLARLTDVNKRISAGLSRLAEGLVSYEDARSIEINAESFNQLPDSIKASLLVFLIKRLKPVHGLARKNVISAVQFMAGSRAGDHHHLPGGLQVVNTYGTFVITSEPGEFSSPSENKLHILSAEKPFSNPMFRLYLTDDKQKGVRVPAQKLYIRYRQPGDKLKPVGMQGTKKLQDIFVDAKVPRHLRGYWPIVVNASNEILWVPQLAQDRRFFEADADQYHYLSCEVI